jgi:hypothetical protein
MVWRLKLWSNNEQDINTLNILWILIIDFRNFGCGKCLPLTMDIDEPWFGS